MLLFKRKPLFFPATGYDKCPVCNDINFREHGRKAYSNVVFRAFSCGLEFSLSKNGIYRHQLCGAADNADDKAVIDRFARRLGYVPKTELDKVKTPPGTALMFDEARAQSAIQRYSGYTNQEFVSSPSEAFKNAMQASKLTP